MLLYLYTDYLNGLEAKKVADERLPETIYISFKLHDVEHMPGTGRGALKELHRPVRIPIYYRDIYHLDRILNGLTTILSPIINYDELKAEPGEEWGRPMHLLYINGLSTGKMYDLRVKLDLMAMLRDLARHLTTDGRRPAAGSTVNLQILKINSKNNFEDRMGAATLPQPIAKQAHSQEFKTWLNGVIRMEALTFSGKLELLCSYMQKDFESVREKRFHFPDLMTDFQNHLDPEGAAKDVETTCGWLKLGLKSIVLRRDSPVNPDKKLPALDPADFICTCMQTFYQEVQKYKLKMQFVRDYVSSLSGEINGLFASLGHGETKELVAELKDKLESEDVDSAMALIRRVYTSEESGIRKVKLLELLKTPPYDNKSDDLQLEAAEAVETEACAGAAAGAGGGEEPSAGAGTAPRR